MTTPGRLSLLLAGVCLTAAWAAAAPAAGTTTSAAPASRTPAAGSTAPAAKTSAAPPAPASTAPAAKTTAASTAPPAGASPEILAVVAELARRRDADQAARRGAGPYDSVDVPNTAWLQGVVAKYGWPTRARFGAQGAHDAWLLLQHATDLSFQVRGLALLEPLVQRGEVDKRDYALLDDRVHVYRGEPQQYGSQFRMNATDMRPCPIADRHLLPERRAAMGLDPMADYAARIHSHHLDLALSLEPWSDCAALVKTAAAPVAGPAPVAGSGVGAGPAPVAGPGTVAGPATPPSGEQK